MSKKILSVVIALSLVFGCFAVVSNAAASFGFEDADATYTQTWELSEPTDNGDGTWTVNVLLTANYSVGPIQFQVNNTNNTGAVLTNAVAGSAIPSNWNARVTKSNTSGKVVITPNPTDDAVYGINNPSAAVVAVLTYTVADGATAQINIVNAPKTELTPGGTLIAARLSDTNIVTGTPIVGQTVASAGSTRNLGAVASVPPELVVIDGAVGAVDTSHTDIDADVEGTTCDGYIYIDAEDNGDTIDSVYEVVGDGELVIVANNQGVENGTGAMAQVVDLDGNVVAEYILIVFGDVNGDGIADVLDAAEIEMHASYMLNDETGRLLTYQAFAGDTNCDTEADVLDAAEIEMHAAYMLNDETGRFIFSEILANLGLI